MASEPTPAPAENVRSFVAVELPPDAREFLQRMQGRLQRCGADVRWTPPDNLHLTLAFLGDVPAADLAPLADALDRAAAGLAPFTLGLGSLGAFGSPLRPRVLWAGLTGDLPALLRLAGAVRAAAQARGLGADDKPFAAHITLGRPRSGRQAAELMGLLRKPPAQAPPGFAVRAIRLMRSRLTPQGAVHTPEHVSVLAGA